MNIDDDSPEAGRVSIFNQPRPFRDINLFSQDRVLAEALVREGASWAEGQLSEYGELAGGEMVDLGFQANASPPQFRSHDVYGERLDQVAYHPAYHRLMELAFAHDLHSLPWKHPQPGAHVARAALTYLHHQAEPGTGCPVTMTFAAMPVLAKTEAVSKDWMPRLLNSGYDGRNLPVEQKSAASLGMAMTEKQGGSDVRANQASALPVGQPGTGQDYELTGHKWFCSAPMSDAFLVLAQAPEGLSCFLLPRWRPDGSRNAFYIQQLKNKLGNRANASAEVEFHGAFAQMLGEPGRGIATILEMVGLTRFDCVTGSASLMRQALTQAIHFSSSRSAFGKVLVDQPLMTNVLADLALESEAALALSLRLARALDHAETQENEKRLLRLATPISKYWVCKRAPGHVYEAMECLGGQGYVEDTILPRLYREAPVNSIWEGSGNIQCLDVIRVIRDNSDSTEALLQELRLAQGLNSLFDSHMLQLETLLVEPVMDEGLARQLVEKLALGLQASLLLRAGNELIGDAFCQARLSPDYSMLYGALPAGINQRAIIERAALT